MAEARGGPWPAPRRSPARRTCSAACAAQSSGASLLELQALRCAPTLSAPLMIDCLCPSALLRANGRAGASAFPVPTPSWRLPGRRRPRPRWARSPLVARRAGARGPTRPPACSRSTTALSGDWRGCGGSGGSGSALIALPSPSPAPGVPQRRRSAGAPGAARRTALRAALCACWCWAWARAAGARCYSGLAARLLAC